jgi:hypothetical protein
MANTQERTSWGISLYKEDLEKIHEMQRHGFNFSSFIREKIHERFVEYKKLRGDRP